uniref:Uncharacterized protein n=1 Tax=Anopheles quadriannulatus TaxID=34691 RepID=A0A182XTC2_ANOQN
MFGPARRWFRNWHPFSYLHRSPDALPDTDVHLLLLPALHPAWLPDELLLPESGRLRRSSHDDMIMVHMMHIMVVHIVMQIVVKVVMQIMVHVVM